MSTLNCRCDVCSSIYMMTPSGFAACPHGHGGLIPGITQRDINKMISATTALVKEKEREALREEALAQLRLLPLCRYIGSAWSVEGLEAQYRRVAGPYVASTRLVESPNHLTRGYVIARADNFRWCVLKELEAVR